MVRHTLLMALWVFVSACGKVGNPIPPERLNPRAVDIVEVVGADNGISFKWVAPDQDERGKALTRLDGHKVYRRELTLLDVSEEGEEPDFDLIETVPDISVDLLKKKRDEARTSGKPLKRIALTQEERTVTFTDKDLENERVYLYKIAPFNQWGFEGKTKKFIKVVYRGLQSEVELLDQTVGDGTLDGSDPLGIAPYGADQPFATGNETGSFLTN